MAACTEREYSGFSEINCSRKKGFFSVVKKVLGRILFIMVRTLAVFLVAAIICGFYFCFRYLYKDPDTEEREQIRKAIEREYPDGFKSLEEWYEADELNAHEFYSNYTINNRDFTIEGNTFTYIFTLDEFNCDADYARKYIDDYLNRYARDNAATLHSFSKVNDITVRYVFKDCNGDECAAAEDTFHFSW